MSNIDIADYSIISNIDIVKGEWKRKFEKPLDPDGASWCRMEAVEGREDEGMMTVKEVSALTGISVRALHYYDQIGLLVPSGKSGSGYRLYDDRALDTLRQILFFREFDLPLGQIKAILEDPDLDRESILRMQRRMLAAKRDRLERLIANIDRLLKGEEQMDFAVFDRSEVEELFEAVLRQMPKELRETAIGEFGSEEAWREHYIEVVSRPEIQAGYAKMVEWYGSKEKYLDWVKSPVSREVAESFCRREEAILTRLAEKRDCAPDSFEVRELVGEYGFVTRGFFQLRDEAGMMLALAESLRDERARPKIEERYGSGAAEFFAAAIEGFYRRG